MEDAVGSSISVFVGVTVILFGGAAWLAGRALALGWKARWLVLPYGLLLACGARFLTYALFEGRLLSWRGYVVSAVVIGGVMLVAHRLYEVRQMVRQYPWMVKPRWLFSWREKSPDIG
ncbi:MAG: hypothetical protein OEU26_35225 [Candidatus Tectomicrobia bacterium]|nr:hypothetical protein [Candidatus Tectomicrobia bacterium]